MAVEKNTIQPRYRVIALGRRPSGSVPLASSTERAEVRNEIRELASGKTLVVASTRGNQKTGVQIDGKDVYLGLNAYVYAEPKAK